MIRLDKTNKPDSRENVNGREEQTAARENPESHGIKKKPIIIQSLSEKEETVVPEISEEGRYWKETLASSEKWPSHPNP